MTRFLIMALLMLAPPAGAAGRWFAVLPDQETEAWRSLAEEWLRAAGEDRPETVTAADLLAAPARPAGGACAVVFGHAGINSLLARWYARGLDSTDLSYPGEGGWVLRWLPDTAEAGPALVAGAASASALAGAKDAFLASIRQSPPGTQVHLSPRWSEVAAGEREWWRSLLALPALTRRQDATRLECFVAAEMKPLAAPESLIWSAWFNRMIHLSSRVAQGVHATGDPEAARLYRRVLADMVAHMIPRETADPAQRNTEDWDYYWGTLIYGVHLARSAVEAEPATAREVARAAFEGVRLWVRQSIYRGPLMGKPALAGVLGGRHEVATLYGIWTTALYLLNSPHLNAAEQEEVRQWRDWCAGYFALADDGPVADDNPIGVDSMDLIALYWLDAGRTQAVQRGGAEWAARCLIGHTDNTFRVASWGYEYLGGPISSHMAAPLRKIACLAGRDDWLARTYRFHNATRGDQVFWMPIARGLSGSPWGAMHDYVWRRPALPDWGRPLDARDRLQVLDLPQARALAVAGKGAGVPHSIFARTGGAAGDAHVVMMGHVGLFFTNAVAGALVHYAAAGRQWLRGSMDSNMAVLHNRAYVSGSRTAESRHAVAVTWRETSDAWSAWEIREAQDNGAAWTRTVVLWQQGSLLVLDRVAGPAGAPPEWLTTWIPLGTPRREGRAWIVRKEDQALWLLADDHHELSLEAQGATVDLRPLPSSPWVLRSVAPGGDAAQAAPRATLLAVGNTSGTPPQLSRAGAAYRVLLPGEAQAWQVTPGERGATVIRIEGAPPGVGAPPAGAAASAGGVTPAPAPTAGSAAPAAPAGVARPDTVAETGMAATPGGLAAPAAPEAATGPAAGAVDLAPLAGLLGAKARAVLEAPAGSALLGEEWISIRSDAPAAVELPSAAKIHSVEVAALRKEPRQVALAFARAGQSAGQPLALDLAAPLRANTWKGYSEAMVVGTARPAAPVDADTVLISAGAGGAVKTRVRIFGEVAPPALGSPFRQVALWPQENGAVWVACVAEPSRLQVVDAEGKPRWAKEEWGAHIVSIAASRGVPARLAALLSDERVVVFGPAGEEIRTLALNRLTPTTYGNVPFRALWADANADGVEDLFVGQFCFEAVFDGRDGRLLGKSGFLSLFWPQFLAVAPGPRLWTAPAYGAVVRRWDIAPAGGKTRYSPSNTVSPQNGGAALCLESVGGPEAPRVAGVREQVVWSRAGRPATEENAGGEYTQLESNADWIWRPPNPLTAAAVDAEGRVLAGDLLGNLHLLDAAGRPAGTLRLPEPPAAIQFLGGADKPLWWVTGRQGHGWLLDGGPRIRFTYAGAGRPWGRAGDCRVVGGRRWWAVAVGSSVLLFGPDGTGTR